MVRGAGLCLHQYLPTFWGEVDSYKTLHVFCGPFLLPPPPPAFIPASGKCYF